MSIPELTAQLTAALAMLPDDERIDALNEVRRTLHEISPMRHHPVDCVTWERADSVHANLYNPNTVAPPEMKLLAHSVEANGYTMPIVTHDTGEQIVIVDGFHRHRIGR